MGKEYGRKTTPLRTVEVLVNALEDAKKQERACLFDLEGIPKTKTGG